MSEEKIELLPCPFCGSKNIESWDVTTYSVDSSYMKFGCKSCDVGYDMSFDPGKEEFEITVKAWNTRPTEPQQVDVDKHPIQPLVKDEHGRLRFKKNDIVDHLLESNADIDLNKLTIMGFSDDDWTQFAQLIGYSFDGWGTLSYVSDDDYERAQQVNQGSESHCVRQDSEESLWVSVEDRLPEEGVQVLIYPPKKGDSHHSNENIGYLSRHGTFEYSNDYTIFNHRDVTHWMPLPQPPTNTEEEG